MGLFQSSWCLILFCHCFFFSWVKQVTPIFTSKILGFPNLSLQYLALKSEIFLVKPLPPLLTKVSTDLFGEASASSPHQGLHRPLWWSLCLLSSPRSPQTSLVKPLPPLLTKVQEYLLGSASSPHQGPCHLPSPRSKKTFLVKPLPPHQGPRRPSGEASPSSPRSQGDLLVKPLPPHQVTRRPCEASPSSLQGQKETWWSLSSSLQGNKETWWSLSLLTTRSGQVSLLSPTTQFWHFSSRESPPKAL